MQFAKAGTYYLYMRFTMYESGVTETSCRRKMTRTTLVLVGLLLAAVAATADSADPAGCDPDRPRALRTPRVAYSATAVRPLNAFRAPGRGVIQYFKTRNANGVRTAFGVLGVVIDRSCSPRWYVVQLPMWPNGRIGWVRAQDVAVRTERTRSAVVL